MSLTIIQPQASGRTLQLTGSMVVDANGNFTVQLTGAGEAVPPEPEPPPAGVTITPTGGDDTAHIQQALNALPADERLILSGMFNVQNTIYLEGYSKTLAGDTSKPSGIRSTNVGIMSGPYASMVCVRGAAECIIRDLEFDAQGHPTELVFFTGTNASGIRDCYLHDISSVNGPPYGAIHSEGCGSIFAIGNRVERTKTGSTNCRGIWIRGDTVLIEGNTVRDSGHTGIAAEGIQILVTGNTVERAQTDGTGYKMCYRQSGYSGYKSSREAQAALQFRENVARDTLNGGLMLEDCGNAAVLIESNNWINCGGQGTTFGALYSPYPVQSLTWRNNRVENCRSLGALRHATGHTFTDTTFSGGSDILYLEDDCHQITLTRSGKVNVGSNCSGITVDGKVIA